MIRSALVNTQTHKQLLTAILLAHPAEPKNCYTFKWWWWWW